MKKSFISIAFILTLSSCFLNTWDVRLILLNNTSERIRYFEQIMSHHEFIPDTIDCNSGELSMVEPHKEQIIRRPEKWEFSLKAHPENTLRVYIINEDTISKYGTSTVFRKQIFMKRFDFTYDDLKKINWRIVFDGK
jgi:hypothetical protein